MAVTNLFDSPYKVVRKFGDSSVVIEWCADNLAGDVVTHGGYYEDDEVWCFEREEDLTLFALKWL